MNRYDRVELQALTLSGGGDCAFLRLMRLERVRESLEVEPEVAALLCELADRVAELEGELRRSRSADAGEAGPL